MHIFAIFSKWLWERGCVIVTVSFYVNSSSNHVCLLFKYNVGNELIGIVSNFSEKLFSIFFIFRFSLTLEASVAGWNQDAELWTLDFGCWTLDFELWILDAGCWALDSRL